jgi:hypothetical protein
MRRIGYDSPGYVDRTSAGRDFVTEPAPRLHALSAYTAGVDNLEEFQDPFDPDEIIDGSDDGRLLRDVRKAVVLQNLRVA